MRGGLSAVALILVASVVLGCEEPRTGADACRRRAAATQFSRNVQNRNNATADAIEDLRCDEIAREERREAIQRERERREDEARTARDTAQAQAQTQARLAAIRRDPKAPELGATRAEAKTICDGERGEWVEKADKIGCKVGGIVVFACEAGEQNILKLVRCTTFFEGGDLSEMKPAVVERLGPPESQAISPSGFRSFSWQDGRFLLEGYARGVKVTLSQTPVSSSDANTDTE